MSAFVLAPPVIPSLGVHNSRSRFPVNRIFCVGRNYAAHAAEMGSEVDREAPFYFLKSPHAVVESGPESAAVLAYPPGTSDLHHEIEMVVAIGLAGFRIAPGDALAHVWGYGSGLDMTRRDLQAKAKAKGRPWDLAKNFEGAAVLSDLQPAQGPLGERAIRLRVNGALRQEAVLSDMVWSVPELVADLSKFYHLAPGDLIMTGTPAGVGAVVAGDRLEGGVEGLPQIRLDLAPAQ
ncbi:MAG: fumarylacetoacetate hydrolase family protein [Paracoccus sp. (in: a-proteobacteria)]|uniref:fumarylacetoacetate hydrolase family protein n=1 Tax=Paracoccus sp. TaxID=267 RepID=UPI0039E364D0